MGFLTKDVVESGRPLSVLLTDAGKKIIKFKQEFVTKPDNTLKLTIEGKPVSKHRFFDHLNKTLVQVQEIKKQVKKNEPAEAFLEKKITKPTQHAKGGLIDKPFYYYDN